VLVPKRAESPDGEVIGDGIVDIGPDDPDYAEWEEYYKKHPEERIEKK
jgi:hypothetical protein